MNMEHPDPECQKRQEDFLKECPDEEREFHARLFRYGNAVYRYHQLAALPINKDSLELYYQEWLQGLPQNIKTDMEKKGFEYCKATLSFTRFVNERTDISMEEWLKDHLSGADYEYYKTADLIPEK